MNTLLTETHGTAITVTLNRPQQRNAMNLEMVEDLLQQLDIAESAPQVRALVLRGACGNFCAGGDVADMRAAQQRADSGDGDAFFHLNRRFGELLYAFSNTPIVIIAALEGAVMGGGFGLACVSDICIADHSARFAMPETRLGLPPAQIAPFVAQRVGNSHARRLALSGISIDAREAHRIGLVHELAADESGLKAQLNRQLEAVCAGAPQALATTKRLLLKSAQAGDDRALLQLLDTAAQQFSRAIRSQEGREGAQAFIEKRPAEWQQR